MKRFLLLCVICLPILGCQFGSGTSGTAQPVTAVLSGPTSTMSTWIDNPMQIGCGVRAPWFESYFTDPTNPASKQGTGAPDGPLVVSLDSARVAIDMAAKSWNLKDVGSSLLHAQRHGMRVRLDLERDDMNTVEVNAVQGENVPTIGDHLAGLMHHKVFIMDARTAGAGS